MPTTLHELAKREITDAHIEDLVEHVRYTPDGLMAGFGHLTKEDVRNIYESVR